MDFRIPLGFAIHLAATIWTHFEPQYEGLSVIFAGFLAFNVLGMLLILAGKIKPGATIYVIGCLPFVPIGMIGALGARKMLQDLKQLQPAV